MNKLAVASFLLIAVASCVVVLARPGVEASPGTYTVNSTADPGDGICDGTECTLREAIAAANANVGTDTIEFNIAGAGPHTISPGSGLPTITDPVTIDGTSEPDFAGSPIIELDGSGAGADVDGLQITAGNSTVRALVINRFDGKGIELSGSGGSTLQGNYIGTDVNGTVDLGNSSYGVLISSQSNVVGGTAAGAGNVISGNGRYGVAIFLDSTGNRVEGNYIGTDITGTADLGNDFDGVYINNSSGNTIGGTAAGARNVISGNEFAGVYITSGASGNHVEGNYIGTDVTGTIDIGNSLRGVSINDSSNNTIGGTAAGAGNVISGNDHEGVDIFATSTGNQVQGNLIGTDVTGTADLGNSWSGVYIYDSSSNTIGGTVAGAGNVISGNDEHGVYIRFTGAAENQVEGNYIGTDVTGTVDLGNFLDGVYIDWAPSNTIGGTAAGAGNVISGNEQRGVRIVGSGAMGNLMEGNVIGTDVTGTAALGNQWGVFIDGAPTNTVGGTTEGARNVISGNQLGVYIRGTGATGNQVQGNFIGTDVTGTADVGNEYDGVRINGAPSNTVGGTTEGARNVISGNDSNGVYLVTGATGNLVQGNYVGTDVNGTAALGNHRGVTIDVASDNTIGGTAAGTGNVIAHNSGDGVWVYGSAANGNTITGNSIHSNGDKGIELANGGNTELAAPVIDGLGGSVSGHTDPKCYPCTVEVFSDSEDEGCIYHGSTTTNDDPTGTWSYSGAVSGPYVTATVTDASGNTSEFSAPVAYSPPPVGGLAELPDVSDSSGRNYIATAGLAAAALLALTAGAWYTRRRWLG